MKDKPIDLDALARDLDALRKEAVEGLGPEDLRHMQKLEAWGRAASALGYASAWVAPNPLSMALLSTGSMARWCIVMHHVGHKGMDRVPGAPPRYRGRAFARGKRRVLDWLDWMLPTAWHYEHDILHHFHTNEVADPDLVEENLSDIRLSDLPMGLRYVVVAFYALTWKLTYYAPNTFQILRRAERRRAAGTHGNAGDARGAESFFAAFDPRTEDGRAFWRACVLPYGIGRFVAIPLLFAPLGPLAVLNVWLNSVGAEALTNLHTFLIVGPNHAGEDVTRFEGPTRSRGEFFRRQILGSVNFDVGGDIRDFFHGFLNYQIEHHLFPDLPPRQYQKIQPRVREICERHGLPYIQENVFTRARKLVDIMVGRASMLRDEPAEAAERAQPEARAGARPAARHTCNERAVPTSA